MPTACSVKTWLKLICFVSQTDAPATGDHDGFVVEGIVDVGQAGVGTGRRLVDLGRTLHVQSLVRTLLVEDLHELVEAGFCRFTMFSRPRRWQRRMPPVSSQCAKLRSINSPRRRSKLLAYSPRTPSPVLVHRADVRLASAPIKQHAGGLPPPDVARSRRGLTRRAGRGRAVWCQSKLLVAGRLACEIPVDPDRERHLERKKDVDTLTQ